MLAKIGVIGAILLAVIAFAFPAILPFALTATEAYWIAGAMFVGSFALDKEAASGMLQDVTDVVRDAVGAAGEAVGEVAGSIGGAVGDIAGGVFGGLLSSPFGIGLLVIGGIYLFSKTSKSTS